MAISVKFEFKENFLKVISSGKDENLEEVKEYGIKVLKKAILTDSKKVLIDERELEHNLSTFDTFESAKFITENTPKFAKVALVCNHKNLPDAKFWETVSFNRGLTVKVFTDIQEAEVWLNS